MQDGIRLIISHQVSKDDSKKEGTQIYLDPKSKEYPYLSHYCSVGTFESIINNLSFRATRLSSARLNDLFEAKRKNIENYTGAFFISCFTHCPYEIVPFWVNYGGTEQSKKIMLRFRNFAPDFENKVCTDYCLTSQAEKLFFDTPEHARTVNINGPIGQKHGFDKINIDYDMRSYVLRLSIFDVVYLPIDDEVFLRDNAGMASVQTNEQQSPVLMPSYDITNLGKHKTLHWTHELETRIVMQLSPPEQEYYDFLDLRVDKTIFEGLEIILSPWAEDALREDIQRIIQAANLEDKIKQSIKILKSELAGQLNF